MPTTTPLSLGTKQRLFTKLLAQLIDYGYSRGYEFTLGDGFRPDGKGHMPNSNHYIKLAQDLNLFILGNWVKTANPAWNDLGKFWKALHPLCRWGGNFASKDYNHFSITFEGRALGRKVVGRETRCMTPAQKKLSRRMALKEA